MLFSRTLVALGLGGLCAIAALRPFDAGAQQIYRSQGSDGRITFSDTRPPGATASAVATPVVTLPAAAGDLSALPFELRQVASRYPVTFYNGPECAPCAAGRALLTGRGIPFTEKTVSSAEDIETLKRLVPAAALPILSIGAQQLKGFSEVEWGQFLDAAGYPRTSQLPAAYQLPPPSPLVVAQQPKPPAPAQRPATAPTPPPAPPPDEPGGIRF